METYINKLQHLAVSQQKKILLGFNLFYALLAFYLFSCLYLQSINNPAAILFYLFAPKLGEAALIIFCIVLLPGIFLRFRKPNKITGIIMLYRRRLGISVYLLAIVHSFLLELIIWAKYSFSYQLATFELFGLAALLLMLPMFLTSNDWSVKKLGKWWKRIHRGIYVVAWLIFGHVLLQHKIWSVLIGFFAALEVVSLAYDFYRKHLHKHRTH